MVKIGREYWMSTVTKSKIISSVTRKQVAKHNFKKKVKLSKERKQQLYEAKEWYTIRALLGNDWANWFVLIGAR